MGQQPRNAKQNQLMKRLLIGLCLMAAFCSDAFAVEWLTDVPTAMERAQKEQKAVLLFFTGSDWCPWCQKLKSEVFDRFEFACYAAANLIMVEVDFPRRKRISTDQLNANYALASKYSVKGYPTVILLNSDGVTLGECSYIEGGPEPFVAAIERFHGMPHKGDYMVAKSAEAPGNPTAHSAAISVAPTRPSGLQQLAALPRPQYRELTLKGISGAGNRRLALINNETLMTGESATVKSFGTNIEVTVKEIRDTSVLIVVKGQTHELSLVHSPGKS